MSINCAIVIKFKILHRCKIHTFMYLIFYPLVRVIQVIGVHLHKCDILLYTYVRSNNRVWSRLLCTY